MNWRRNAAMAFGAVITITVFVGAVLLLVFGGYFKEHELLIYVSIAIAPVAMMAAIIGYAVWWLVLFLLTLISSGNKNYPGS